LHSRKDLAVSTSYLYETIPTEIGTLAFRPCLHRYAEAFRAGIGVSVRTSGLLQTGVTRYGFRLNGG